MKSIRPPEVTPGVFQLRVPMPDNPLGYLLAYYLPGPHGNTLIDTGWNDEGARAALEEQVALCGGRLEEIKQVLVTHCHPDHAGLAERIRAQAGATLVMHHREAAYAALRRRTPVLLLRKMGAWLVANGMPPEEQLALEAEANGDEIRKLFPGPADRRLRGGEELAAGRFFLQVVPTPGHSPGHICFYEPTQRLLFAGDHVLPGITPNIRLEPAPGSDNPLAAYLASLKRVAALPVELVLPAHEHSFTGLKARAEEIAAHHRARSNEIIAHLGRNGSTAYQVAQKVTWAKGAFEHLTGWNRYMAVLEVLSHLRLAWTQARVESEQRAGVIYFRPR